MPDILARINAGLRRGGRPMSGEEWLHGLDRIGREGVVAAIRRAPADLPGPISGALGSESTHVTRQGVRA